MSPSWLSAPQVSAVLGLSLDTVHRRLAAGDVPHIRITPRLLRCEARAVRPDAPAPVPPGPEIVSSAWVAQVLQLHRRTVHQLAWSGLLPGHLLDGRWVFRRTDLERLVERLVVGRAA